MFSLDLGASEIIMPAFLERWNAGVTVIDATFEANAWVRDSFSTEPRDYLAMHVYGDALRKKVLTSPCRHGTVQQINRSHSVDGGRIPATGTFLPR